MSLVKRVPFWAWIGCGCAGAIGAIVLGTAGLFFWSVQRVGDYAESMLDPAERLEKTLNVLHADELPEGYYAILAFSIFGAEVAILSSNPSGEDGRPRAPTQPFLRCVGRRCAMLCANPSVRKI